jgi:hypothetical protein
MKENEVERRTCKMQGEKRKRRKILIDECEGKRLLGSARLRFEDDIKANLR